MAESPIPIKTLTAPVRDLPQRTSNAKILAPKPCLAIPGAHSDSSINAENETFSGRPLSFGPITALGSPVTILAPATAVDPKGIRSTQTADGASGTIPHSRFASVLSSAELMTSGKTETATAALGDTTTGITDALKNLLSTLVRSADSQPGVTETRVLVTASQKEANPKAVAGNASRPDGKKQRRADVHESVPGSTVFPMTSQPKLLTLNLGGGSEMLPVLSSLILVSPIGDALNTPSTPGKGAAGATPSRDQEQGAELAAQTTGIMEEGSEPATPQVSNAVDSFGHLSFLLRLVDPARPAGPKDPSTRSDPGPNNCVVDLTGHGIGAEQAEGDSILQGRAEPAIPAGARLNSPVAPSPDEQDVALGSFSMSRPAVPTGSTLWSSPTAPGAGIQSRETRSQQFLLTSFGQVATVRPTNANPGGKSFGDQPSSGGSAPRRESAHEEFGHQEVKHQEMNLQETKIEEATIEDPRVLSGSGRTANFTPPLEGSPQQSIPSFADRVGEGSGQQLAAPRSPTMPSLTQPPPATAVSQIAIRLDASGESGQVELRIRERGGEVQIAVRTTDQGVATTLRQDLGELVKRLEPHATNTEVFRPDSSTVEPGSHQVRHLPGSDSSRGYSYFSDDAQQRQRQQQQQQDRQRATQPEAAGDAKEELRSLFNDLSNGALSQ